MIIVETRNLKKIYNLGINKVYALNGVDLSIEEGAIRRTVCQYLVAQRRQQKFAQFFYAHGFFLLGLVFFIVKKKRGRVKQNSHNMRISSKNPHNAR